MTGRLHVSDIAPYIVCIYFLCSMCMCLTLCSSIIGIIYFIDIDSNRTINNITYLINNSLFY